MVYNPHLIILSVYDILHMNLTKGQLIAKRLLAVFGDMMRGSIFNLSNLRWTCSYTISISANKYLLHGMFWITTV